MLPHTHINRNLENLDFTTTKTNKKITYINLACGFDIETTSIMEQGQKVAFMYVWQLGLGHGQPVYYGRTWEELQTSLATISERLELDTNNRLVIYVHNLGYEFQFMRKHFEWLDIFSVSERKPLKAVCSLGIEFRCSYMLSGFSLDGVARNLTKHTINKKNGDLDYSLIRHEKTPLTSDELGYCKSDIEIITAYITEQLEIYETINRIPLTNTGRVRSLVRDECYYSSSNHRKSSKGKYIKYRKIMSDLTVTPEIYGQLKKAFMGGFTHANANKSGQLLTEISSIDFTSSYPAVMVAEKFPMARFRPFKPNTLGEFELLCRKNAVIFDIQFINIRAKISQEVYISESKCQRLENPIINNGRIYSADFLQTTLTEIDYEIMLQVYEWDEINLSNVNYSPKNYLPKAIVKSILDLYQDKTELKDVQGYEVEYMLSKGMLNSIYGMCVTDIVKDETTYEHDEWSSEPANLIESIDSYNDSKNRFLYYPWGVWVTAYARRNLWTGIIAAGDNYVYADTDSLKVSDYSQLSDYIKFYDNNIMKKMGDCCDFYGFDKALLEPKTKEGVPKPLGVWDFEGTYTRFKTLGAKRYLVEENGKLALTVAGLSKQNGLTYLLETYGNNLEVFSNFTDELYIPATRTGKMTHTYIDDEYKIKVIDYLGNANNVLTLSGIHLEPCDFTLSISEQYSEFMDNLSKGYLLTGLKHD